MNPRFYEIAPGYDHKHQWSLDDPIDANGNAIKASVFDSGRRADLALPLRITVSEFAGDVPLDFTLATFGIPVVNMHTLDVLQRVAPDDIQSFTAYVDGRSEEYAVINTLKLIPCIDEEQTEEFQKWTEE